MGDACGVFPLALGVSLAKEQGGKRTAHATDVVGSW